MPKMSAHSNPAGKRPASVALKTTPTKTQKRSSGFPSPRAWQNPGFENVISSDKMWENGLAYDGLRAALAIH